VDNISIVILLSRDPCSKINILVDNILSEVTINEKLCVKITGKWIKVIKIYTL